MDSNDALNRESELTEIMKVALTELQVALIYQDKLDERDYSRPIKTLDSICSGVYETGRTFLEEIEDLDEYTDIMSPERYTSESSVVIDEGGTKWMTMGEKPEEHSKLLKKHENNVNASTPSYQGRVVGSELRNWLEMYEELRESASAKNVYNFSKLDDRLVDESFGQSIVEGEDAEII